MPRDEFTKATKLAVAQRAAYHCSNPGCRRLTIGPHSDPAKALSIGDAGHIKGARGPRFDPLQTHDERRSDDNAIWLCKACHGLVDGDESAFSAEQLMGWKRDVELEAQRMRDVPSAQTPEVTIVMSWEDAAVLRGFEQLAARRREEDARAAACTVANANKDYAEILALVQGSLLPVRKQGYERIKEHTRCRSRDMFVRLLHNKFAGHLGSIQVEDRCEILRLLERAKAWELAPYVLGYWRRGANEIREPETSALRSFFTEELYNVPSELLELVRDELLELASLGKPAQPTGPLLWIIAHATEQTVTRLSPDDWAKVDAVHNAYATDASRFSEVRTFARALGKDTSAG